MMTLRDSTQFFRPAVALEKIISRRSLTLVRHLGFWTFLTTSIGTAGLYFFPGLVPDAVPYRNLLAGAALLGLAVWLDSFLAIAYHNSYYFRGLRSILGLEEAPVSGATYDVAKAVLKQPDDVALAFLMSSFGRESLLRVGITETDIDHYLQNPRQKISAAMVTLPEREIFSLIGLGAYLLAHDVALVDLLKRKGVRQDNFLGALRWVVGTYHQKKRQARWWGRDNLSRTEGIGQELATGVAYQLQRFSRDIRTSAVFSTLTRDSAFAAEKVTAIEQALASAKASNVLLIGEAGVGKIDLVMEVKRRLGTGEALDAIAGEHIYVLDTNRLFAVFKDKPTFEQGFLELLDEATRAGHVIIVIENLSVFVREAEALGVFIPELIDAYLGIPDLHFIATDTPGAYHTHLETLGGFTRRFSEILIETPNQQATVRVLQSIALKEEIARGCLVTYPALVATAEAADRYLVEGVMPDKAISLLLRVLQQATTGGISIVSEEFVYQVVSAETGVPAGPISDDERDLLLHLEDSLHQMVIGQQAALDAIAGTMRRARAGIQSSEKPIGSFLFLGPTGVGKTETAKAMATIFFGGEQNLRRLDMSEYSGTDAVDRLIGTGEQPGTLSTLLREHPYCVVLLDEFEKAAQPVHDIFLQVLDEGKFTDGRGQMINARNSIIIATSNAGSQLILKTVENRQSLTALNEEIISHIIANGTYRPELINRFDSTVIFEPLNQGEQLQVASLLLRGLYERIKDRGYDLQVGTGVLELLVEHGYDPEFGARPMQRVLQDVIEEAVAQKIISGTSKKGDTITLTVADVTPLLPTT